jgi:hypothetical protein
MNGVKFAIAQPPQRFFQWFKPYKEVILHLTQTHKEPQLLTLSQFLNWLWNLSLSSLSKQV